MDDFIKALNSTMPMPTFFGWFHCIFFFFTLIAILLFLVFRKKLKDKNVRIIIFVLWFILIAMESLKQIYIAHPIIDGAVTFKYDFAGIPYQVCGLPLLFLPFIVFLKDSKFRDVLINFCGTFLFLAGIAVIFYPGDCFSENIFLNFSGMVHHSAQAISCSLIAIYYYDKLTIKKVTICAFIMAFFVILAVIFNQIAYDNGIISNYFMIGKYGHSKNPIIQSIFDSVPYWFIVIIFIVLFYLLAIMTFSLEKLTHLAYEKISKNIEKKKTSKFN